MTRALRILLHNDDTSEMAQQLSKAAPFAEIAECNSYGDLPSKISAFLPDIVYSIRFAGTPGFPRDALFSQNGPEWLAIGGAGTDHLGTWNTDQITVTNAAGVAAEMMAEYVIGGFLHFSLNIPGMQRDQSERVWAMRTVSPLKGKTLAILGLGHTGRAIAKRAKAFGMTVLGTRANPKPMESVDEVGGPDRLEDFLAQSDFIAVSSPLVPSTQGMLGAKQLKAGKPGAILADVSRGGVVDQSALRAALESGHIAAAALDVFETEPLPKDSAFWAMENVLISPHCSSVHSEWAADSFALFLKNLARWQEGDPLLNVVDPGRGY